MKLLYFSKCIVCLEEILTHIIKSYTELYVSRVEDFFAPYLNKLHILDEAKTR